MHYYLVHLREKKWFSNYDLDHNAMAGLALIVKILLEVDAVQCSGNVWPGENKKIQTTK